MNAFVKKIVDETGAWVNGKIANVEKRANVYVGTEAERLALTKTNGIMFNQVAADGSVREFIVKNGVWSEQHSDTDKVTIHVSTSDGASVEGVTMTIINHTTGVTNTYTLDSTGIVEITESKGDEFTIKVSSLSGYLDIEQSVHVAVSDSQVINLVYQTVPQDEYCLVIDQTIADPSTSGGKVTHNGSQTFMNTLCAHTHRYLTKHTDTGKVVICKLDDSDSRKYYDGTSAVLTGEQGDVMVRCDLDIYIKCEDLNTDVVKIWLSMIPRDGFIKWNYKDSHLIGAFEASYIGNKLRSVTGRTPDNNKTRDVFKTNARNNGTGWQLVPWFMHCFWAIIYYAKYQNTDSQGTCGYGTTSYKETGQTASIGMTDTVGSNGQGTGQGDNMSINFCGLENWWGNYAEWFDDYDVDTNCTVTVKKPDMTNRTFEQVYIHNGWSSVPVKRFKFGTYIDIANSAKTTPDSGTSQTTYYCDNQWMADESSGSEYRNQAHVAFRSGYLAYASGGVSCAVAGRGVTVAVASIGSRLAFIGTVTEATSVAEFLSTSDIR